MILLSKINKIEDKLEYQIYNSNTSLILKNVSSHSDGTYIFKEPAKGAENDRFIITHSGNKEIISDTMISEIFHYVLLKEHEKSSYLIDKSLFDILLKKI